MKIYVIKLKSFVFGQQLKKNVYNKLVQIFRHKKIVLMFIKSWMNQMFKFVNG